MAGPLFFDRCQENSTTTGTGPYTLSGATTSYQAWSVVGNGNTAYYMATDGTGWEVGLGTYTLSGTTLARTTILASSNANAAVNWTAGTKTISQVEPAGWLTNPIVTGSLTLRASGAGEAYVNSSNVVATRPVYPIEAYGGIGDGTTNNVTALNAALAALPSGGGCISFGPGKFNFGSSVSYSLSGARASVTLEGVGADGTILYWPNAAGGLTLAMSSASHTVHVKNLSFTTGVATGGAGLTISNSVLLGHMGQSDVTGVTFRGDDGGASTDYWTNSVAVVGASNINFIDDLFYGDSTGTHGVGVSLQGVAATSPFYGIVYNFSNCEFFNENAGILYGSYIQGVTVSQCNFTNGGTGIQSNGSELGSLAQLIVMNSQFNTQNAQIATITPIDQTMITGNLFYVPANSFGVELLAEWQFSITGNIFAGAATPISSTGIYVGTSAASNDAGTIVGNVFYNLVTGVNISAGANNVLAQSNKYAAVTNSVVNSGTGSQVWDTLLTTTASGVAVSGSLTTAAGTTTVPPLLFQAGTNLTTAVAGAQEFDGKAFYLSAAASSRQVIDLEQVTILSADNTAPTNVATAQNVFPTGQGTLTVQGAIAYEFEAVYRITRSAGTTSHTTSLLFGGTATFTAIDYLATCANPSGNILSTPSQIWQNAATAIAVTAANTSATENLFITIRGTMRINAAGTVIPQFQYSTAPGGAPTIKADSFFRCWPIGSNTVTSVGNWS